MDNVSNLENKIKKIILPLNIQHLAVAVSGGSDSLALTLLLSKICDQNTIKFIAITVNHNLRAEAKEEALYVNSLLTSNNIKHIILDWNHDELPLVSNIQANARKARYTLMTNFCYSNNIEYLCTAHNK
jgi:tRNA(Ile)-lysidine synthase